MHVIANTGSLVLPRVDEDASPEESDRAINGRFGADISAEIRIPFQNDYDPDLIGNADNELDGSKDVMIPNIDNKQKSAPLNSEFESSFITPKRRRNVINRSSRNQSSSESNDEGDESENSSFDINFEGAFSYGPNIDRKVCHFSELSGIHILYRLLCMEVILLKTRKRIHKVIFSVQK